MPVVRSHGMLQLETRNITSRLLVHRPHTVHLELSRHIGFSLGTCKRSTIPELVMEDDLGTNWVIEGQSIFRK